MGVSGTPESSGLRRVVIVGAAPCGVHAAETLREEGFDGEVVLVGAEPHLPYDRPPLSKSFLTTAPPEEPEDPAFHPRSFYDEQRIRLELGAPVTAVLPGERAVQLRDGRRLAGDRFLLATGSRLRRLDVPGGDLPGVRYLRTRDDARALREAILRSRRAVVVGAGFIGCEVAASCRARGLDVTLLDAGAAPLERALGAEVGRRIGDLHRAHGVDVRMGERVAAFRGAGRVEQVATASGAVLEADLVVVGVGVVPETGYLEGSGVAAEDGILVDERCRTSVPGIFAAGDCARWPLGGARVCIEHWENAWYQAEAAVRTVLGRDEPYDPLPYFWSDQYDFEIQYIGHAARWDRVAYRGDPAGTSFAAFYLEGGLLRAAMCLGRPDEEVEEVRRLVRAGARPDPARLSDPDTDLAGL
jgi:3-phenylpropionate/trans-cinnamate dioxygenase ferredoxin reductase subunit